MPSVHQNHSGHPVYYYNQQENFNNNEVHRNRETIAFQRAIIDEQNGALEAQNNFIRQLPKLLVKVFFAGVGVGMIAAKILFQTQDSDSSEKDKVNDKKRNDDDEKVN